MDEPKIIKKVDEAWKERADKERVQVEAPAEAKTAVSAPASASGAARSSAEEPHQQPKQQGQPKEAPATEFTYFLSTLSMQAMIGSAYTKMTYCIY